MKDGGGYGSWSFADSQGDGASAGEYLAQPYLHGDSILRADGDGFGQYKLQIPNGRPLYKSMSTTYAVVGVDVMAALALRF